MNKPLCCLLYFVLFWFTFKNENVSQSLLVLEEDLYGQAVKIINSFLLFHMCKGSNKTVSSRYEYDITDCSQLVQLKLLKYCLNALSL